MIMFKNMKEKNNNNNRDQEQELSSVCSIVPRLARFMHVQVVTATHCRLAEISTWVLYGYSNFRDNLPELLS